MHLSHDIPLAQYAAWPVQRSVATTARDSELEAEVEAANMHTAMTLSTIPDELVLHILLYLDVAELLALSRTSHRLRTLALDPLLHIRRLRASISSLATLLPHRPPLQSLQPPSSHIYLTRTHVAARRLHYSLLRIRLNRSLSRRPCVAALVSANIVPAECCRRDRASGEIVIGKGFCSGGLVVERKRRVEREMVKEGLRVWLERKAGEILRKRKALLGEGVGTLVWRFSKRAKLAEADAVGAGATGSVRQRGCAWETAAERGRVEGLKRFWEGVVVEQGTGVAA